MGVRREQKQVVGRCTLYAVDNVFVCSMIVSLLKGYRYI